ncbi:MAG: ATP-binding protein [Bacteroidota bacterium]
MNCRYIIGIVITLTVLSINQYFIQYWLSQKKYDANTINIAGKQRMLSQRINAEFYRIQYDKHHPDVLYQLVDQWKTAHFDLQKTRYTDKVNPVTCTQNQLALKALDGNIKLIESQLKKVDRFEFDLDLINQNQEDYLPKMDRIVKKLEQASDEKLQFIVRIEYLLFFISLVILILEVIYIYVPIEKSLRQANKNVERKNKNLEKAYNEIRKKNKELEQMTYITSHDLQEPVRTINSLVHLLQSKYANAFDEQGSKMLKFLDNATLRMRDLIKDLLDYSIIGKEKEKTRVDCHQLLASVKEGLAAEIKQSDAKIYWKEMPEIVGIATELKLLFHNLIANAIKFQATDHTPIININASERETHWLFTVADNGIGIEPKNLDKIFSIFHRVHSKYEFEGTGIGLAHCAKVVDIHGGDIWVESEVNVGSTFFFTINKFEVEKSKQHEEKTEFNFAN